MEKRSPEAVWSAVYAPGEHCIAPCTCQADYVCAGSWSMVKCCIGRAMRLARHEAADSLYGNFCPCCCQSWHALVAEGLGSDGLRRCVRRRLFQLRAYDGAARQIAIWAGPDGDVVVDLLGVRQGSSRRGL